MLSVVPAKPEEISAWDEYYIPQPTVHQSAKYYTKTHRKQQTGFLPNVFLTARWQFGGQTWQLSEDILKQFSLARKSRRDFPMRGIFTKDIH